VNWSAAFLGLIAAATLVMAAIQVGAVIYAARLAGRVERLTARVERDLAPTLERVNAVSVSVARTAELAARQAERADRVFSDVSRRVEETAALLQDTIVTPARHGRAMLMAVSAALGAFHEISRERRRHQAPLDEDDPLFIG
jgi:hypothetical protein